MDKGTPCNVGVLPSLVRDQDSENVNSIGYEVVVEQTQALLVTAVCSQRAGTAVSVRY